MKKKIDRKTVREARDLPKDTRIFDTEMRGFFVRANGPESAPSYGVMYGPAKRRRQVTIGGCDHLILEEARAEARRILAGSDLGVDEAEERMKQRKEDDFSTWKEEYLKHAAERKKTWKRDEQYLALADTLFGKKRLTEITLRDCYIFFERTKEKRGNTSANRALASLKTCLGMAWRLGHIEVNPSLRVKPLKEPPPRTRVFSSISWLRLLIGVRRLTDPHAKAGMALLFSTGCRLSEALNLRWEDADLKTGVLRFPNPKAGKPQSIPIPESLVELLKKVPKTSKYIVAGKDPEKPRADLKRAWKSVTETARVEGNIHDVRRTVGTLLARRYGLEVAQHILRHASPNVTWRHYVQSQDKELRGALEGVAVESKLGRVLAFTPKPSAS